VHLTLDPFAFIDLLPKINVPLLLSIGSDVSRVRMHLQVWDRYSVAPQIGDDGEGVLVSVHDCGNLASNLREVVRDCRFHVAFSDLE
jgi:hypothetical protein